MTHAMCDFLSPNQPTIVFLTVGTKIETKYNIRWPSVSDVTRSAPRSANTTNNRYKGRPRVQCQLCGKLGHLVDRCWHRFDQSFKGIAQSSRSHTSPQANTCTCSHQNKEVSMSVHVHSPGANYSNTVATCPIGVTDVEVTAEDHEHEMLSSCQHSHSSAEFVIPSVSTEGTHSVVPSATTEAACSDVSQESNEQHSAATDADFFDPQATGSTESDNDQDVQHTVSAVPNIVDSEQAQYGAKNLLGTF
ncbi:hypothetical protein GQ457_03G032700 [Hibiscus cannabinus]